MRKIILTSMAKIAVAASAIGALTFSTAIAPVHADDLVSPASILAQHESGENSRRSTAGAAELVVVLHAAGVDGVTKAEAPDEYTATLDGVEVDAQPAERATAPGCAASDPATKRLNTYQRRKPSGVAKLECGNSSYGWRHITTGKARDWQNIINKYNLKTDWATFAKWNMANTVGSPSSAPYNSSNKTYTYQAPLQIRNAQGQVVRTYTIRVPVGSTTERIITAFPS